MTQAEIIVEHIADGNVNALALLRAMWKSMYSRTIMHVYSHPVSDFASYVDRNAFKPKVFRGILFPDGSCLPISVITICGTEYVLPA